MPLLEVKGITKQFGGLVSLNEVTLEIHQGEIVGLIGPNGAGKTTLFNVISGYYQPDFGEIFYNGRNITGFRSDQINQLGIARTFQTMRPFVNMTVLENVMVGILSKTSDMGLSKQMALRYIEFVGLMEKADSFAGGLSTGQRKRLEMARAMATQPKLLLLDEVTGGVDPRGVPALVELMKGLRDEGITLLIIEHRIKVITSICDRIIALHLGSKIADGTPEEVTHNRQVIDSYLGEVYA
ncbi:MAG: ABC transporter ATP-binding protein [Thermodesulfobacteriota bacterium]